MFFKRFVLKNGASQIGFPIVFLKCNLTKVGSFFCRKKNSEKAKHPKICVSFGGSMPITQIKWCHLTPSPILVFFDQGNSTITDLRHG